MTGVWVNVPATDVESDSITLRGPQEKLGQALTMVSLDVHKVPHPPIVNALLCKYIDSERYTELCNEF